MYNILVSDSMSPEGLTPLLNDPSVVVIQKNVSEPELCLDEIDALLVRSATTVTEDLLNKMPRLKIIARAGVGVDNIDVEAATKQGIIVINAPDGNTISTAEHTFAMIASLARNIPQATASIKAGNWNRKHFQGIELYGKTLGVIGLGRIGTELSSRAKAFGMKVTVFDPYLTAARAEEIGVKSLSLQEVLQVADIISVHTPLTKDTKGLLNFETISQTKKGVLLINCARGGIIDEEALIHYIENGHVAGAALDVFETEPKVRDKFIELSEVIVTPHIAASTKEAQLNVAAQVSEEVLQYFKGNPVSSSINMPAISKEVYEQIYPYYELAKAMGSFTSQWMNEPVQEVTISYGGEVSNLETSILTRSLLSGFLKSRVDSGVNEVNAGLIAKQRGISYGEKLSSDGNGYSNSLSVHVKGDNHEFSITGTLINDYGARIVSVNHFSIDFSPTGNLICIQHTDKPGVIGHVGKILGDLRVNIATMQVGRKEAGGEAMMMLSFDETLEDELVHQLTNVDDIVSVKRIEIS